MLWAGLLAEDEVTALGGAEVSLLQAVGRAMGSPRRREVITAYWKLSAALARLAVVSSAERRRQAIIDARLATLQARARAVVLAEFARSQGARRYGSDGEELQAVLDAMQKQMSQTQSLLRLLTQYNLGNTSAK